MFDKLLRKAFILSRAYTLETRDKQSSNSKKISRIIWMSICKSKAFTVVINLHHYNDVTHYGDVIMTMMASQITSLKIVYSAVYSGADQRKHQSPASLAFLRGIHRWPVNSPRKGPVPRKMFPFDDVIMVSAAMASYITGNKPLLLATHRCPSQRVSNAENFPMLWRHYIKKNGGTNLCDNR